MQNFRQPRGHSRSTIGWLLALTVAVAACGPSSSPGVGATPLPGASRADVTARPSPAAKELPTLERYSFIGWSGGSPVVAIRT